MYGHAELLRPVPFFTIHLFPPPKHQTGKTITLLSLITSYKIANRERMGKLIYCTRTIPEMEKVSTAIQT